MINVKKGAAHTLQQTDKIGPVVASEGVVAGMLVKYDPTANSSTGGIKKVASATVAGLVGFALNNQTDGDVIESGKLGFYQLDGGSIIETDQFTNGSLTDADVGKAAIASATAGKVTITDTPSTNRVVGIVDSVRTLPAVTIPSVGGTTPNWETTTVVAIKLASN